MILDLMAGEAGAVAITAEQASERRQSQMRAMRFGCLRQIGLAPPEPEPDATFPAGWGERDAVV